MDHLSEHREILENAINSELPSRINRSSDISVDIFQELYEEGLMTAIDVSSMNEGTGYINPAITLKKIGVREQLFLIFVGANIKRLTRAKFSP